MRWIVLGLPGAFSTHCTRIHVVVRYKYMDSYHVNGDKSIDHNETLITFICWWCDVCLESIPYMSEILVCHQLAFLNFMSLHHHSSAICLGCPLKIVMFGATTMNKLRITIIWPVMISTLCCNIPSFWMRPVLPATLISLEVGLSWGVWPKSVIMAWLPMTSIGELLFIGYQQYLFTTPKFRWFKYRYNTYPIVQKTNIITQ